MSIYDFEYIFDFFVQKYNVYGCKILHLIQ